MRVTRRYFNKLHTLLFLDKLDFLRDYGGCKVQNRGDLTPLINICLRSQTHAIVVAGRCHYNKFIIKKLDFFRIWFYLVEIIRVSIEWMC